MYPSERSTGYPFLGLQVGVVLISVGAGLYSDKNVEANYMHGVVFDAGSSHTSAMGRKGGTDSCHEGTGFLKDIFGLFIYYFIVYQITVNKISIPFVGNELVLLCSFSSASMQFPSAFY